MNDVTVSSFVVPSERVELNGEKGLDLHQIAQSLGIEFAHAKRRFEELQAEGEITGVGYLSVIESLNFLRPSRETESYVLTLDDAKFLITQYQNKIGRAYCKWLIQQENTIDNILANPREAAKALSLLADRQEALQRQKAIADYTLKALTTSQSKNAPLTVKVNKLETENRKLLDQVGDSNTWKRAIAARNMHRYIFEGLSDSGLGKLLTKTSRESGRQINKIPDSKYGFVNVYHIEVVKKAAQAYAALKFVMAEQLM